MTSENKPDTGTKAGDAPTDPSTISEIFASKEFLKGFGGFAVFVGVVWGIVQLYQWLS
ncbi:MAG: hypothetical protein JKY60_18570 [Kordiimonadaceae bacterium]|nr:hypothetical protein [Kordiimonadaceae bacterium]